MPPTVKAPSYNYNKEMGNERVRKRVKGKAKRTLLKHTINSGKQEPNDTRNKLPKVQHECSKQSGNSNRNYKRRLDQFSSKSTFEFDVKMWHGKETFITVAKDKSR